MAKKVLIAEDSSVIQNLARRILEQQNFEITAAKDGNEVMEAIEKEDFDLILMDINIPKIDGMDCSRRIRSLNVPSKAKTPIFAITGNAQNYSLEDFREVGINEFLPKPLNFDNLVELVIKYTAVQ